MDQNLHGWFPSQNNNRFDFLGLQESVEQADIQALIDLYKRAGVPRFFIYLLPILAYQQVWQILDRLEFRQGVELAVLERELNEKIELHDKNLYISMAKNLRDVMTVPRYRRQGFQTALIRERLRIAKEYDCRFAYTATYDFLPSSYDNLIRNGFQERFRTAIFRYEMGPALRHTLSHTTEGHMPPH